MADLAAFLALLEIDLALLVVLHELVEARAREGHLAKNQDVEHNSEAEHIHPGVVVVRLKHFGRYVPDCSDPLGGQRDSFLGGGEIREPEVRQADVVDVVRRAEINIVQLDVSVHDVLGVHVAEGGEEFLDDFGQHLLLDALQLSEAVLDVPAVEHLHHDENIQLVFVDLEDLLDALVVEAPQDADLKQQLLLARVVLELALVHNAQAVLLLVRVFVDLVVLVRRAELKEVLQLGDDLVLLVDLAEQAVLFDGLVPLVEIVRRVGEQLRLALPGGQAEAVLVVLEGLLRVLDFLDVALIYVELLSARVLVVLLALLDTQQPIAVELTVEGFPLLRLRALLKQPPLVNQIALFLLIVVGQFGPKLLLV